MLWRKICMYLHNKNENEIEMKIGNDANCVTVYVFACVSFSGGNVGCKGKNAMYK